MGFAAATTLTDGRLIWGEDRFTSNQFTPNLLREGTREPSSISSVCRLSLTPLCCWRFFKCQQQNWCDAKHIFVRREQSFFTFSCLTTRTHWWRCCLCLHVSNRCGRRPSFWGKNWLNSMRMKCLILNSSARPWWAHLFSRSTHRYHEVKWPTKI